jgi:PKD repeat protein
MVDDLAAWREPWEVHHDQGFLVVDVTRAGYDRLVKAGFRVEVDEELTDQLSRPRSLLAGQTSGIPGFPCYRTVEETFLSAEAIVTHHPDLAAWIDVGDSWEKTQDPGGGHDLSVLRLTNPARPGPKSKLFVLTSLHGREYTPAELVTRFAEFLVDSYDSDADVTWLLDYAEVHLLLQANPDGRRKAEAGLSWRKNTNTSYCTSSPNLRGADLNRNFEFEWNCCGGSSSVECETTYRGPSAASEPETQAIQQYFRDHFPRQRPAPLSSSAPVTATGVFLDIHSHGELVLWPWGFDEPVPNHGGLQTLGRKLAYFNGYVAKQASELYRTDGTAIDFGYGELGLATFTFEVGNSFFQDCATFESAILPDNLLALIHAAKVSRTPYLTPAGPESVDVVVSAPIVFGGDRVTLTATIDDARYSNAYGTEPSQAISATEYYIDVPPWATSPAPLSIPMAAVDHVFDEVMEPVEATVDTASLGAGRHIIFVRGQDRDANWGPFTAVFLHVLDSAVSPTIAGYVRETGTDLPLLATVRAGPFETTSNPASGYYSMTVVSGTFDLVVGASGHATSTIIGVEAQDSHGARRDFQLYPTCEAFSDTVESGNVGWTAAGNWSITTEDSHSGANSWTDSPGGSYENRSNHTLLSPILDMSEYEGSVLSFWHAYDLEDNWDRGLVEYSADGGAMWKRAMAFTGRDQTTWTHQAIWMPALDGQSSARIRFSLYSDNTVVEDGWHIDDISLIGGGPACDATYVPPTAAFTSTGPASVGHPVTFTNLSVGSPPLSYLWDFGDGSDGSTARDPAHRYPSAGRFAVTLVVTNSARGDSDTVSRTVAVDEPIAGLMAANSSPTPLGSPTMFTATVTAGTFITYTWGFGDGEAGSGSAVSHTYGAIGVYRATVIAANSVGARSATTMVFVGSPLFIPLLLRP